MHRLTKISLCLLLLLPALNCKPRKFELGICKETDAGRCIPPLIATKATYFVNANHTGSLLDYLNSVYFGGETLSFHFVNLDSYKKKVDWHRDFAAFYSFPGSNKRFAMGRVDVQENSITGFSNLGSILLRRFAEKQDKPYFNLPPVSVRYEFYIKKKRFAYRTVTISLRNE